MDGPGSAHRRCSRRSRCRRSHSALRCQSPAATLPHTRTPPWSYASPHAYAHGLNYRSSSSRATRLPSLSRFLLVVLVVSQLCASSVEVVAESSGRGGGGDSQNVVRTYRLYARCSEKQVQVRGRRVNAQAKHSNNYTLLEVESVRAHRGNDSHYYVRLQSVKYKTYICFNKKGGLRVMQYGHHARCKFKMHETQDHFTEFHVATPEKWLIGFGKSGKPLTGSTGAAGVSHHRNGRHSRRRRRQRKRKCYQFTKVAVASSSLNGRGRGSSGGRQHGPMSGVDSARLQDVYRRMLAKSPTSPSTSQQQQQEQQQQQQHRDTSSTHHRRTYIAHSSSGNNNGNNNPSSTSSNIRRKWKEIYRRNRRLRHHHPLHSNNNNGNNDNDMHNSNHDINNNDRPHLHSLRTSHTVRPEPT